jgi:hypothetical protein
MKIWWPWRRMTTVQSLFEGRISSDGVLLDPPNGTEKHIPGRPHAKNAPGPFYVEDTECMACGYPHVLAPDLMGWELDKDGRYSHCYFKRQPESSYEITQATNAIGGSCCGALCYSGSDPEVLKALRKSGSKHAIV